MADSVLFSGHRDGATAHGPSLPALVKEALAISEVDEVVVGMGPGPFTGLKSWYRLCAKFWISS